MMKSSGLALFRVVLAAGWVAGVPASAAGVLLATAYEGGELVFTHNMGTAASLP